jgi:hypothetical protein
MLILCRYFEVLFRDVGGSVTYSVYSYDTRTGGLCNYTKNAVGDIFTD